MKPKGQNENDTGMLEFLEDIIGTSRYKEPLEKLTNKVDELTERRVEKLHRLRVVQKEKEALEEPMQEAVQYLKMENAIIRLQYQLYHCKRWIKYESNFILFDFNLRILEAAQLMIENYKIFLSDPRQ